MGLETGFDAVASHPTIMSFVGRAAIKLPPRDVS